MKLLLALACSLFASSYTGAQDLSAFAGARSEALSGASVCLEGVWAAHQNVAATAALDRMQLALSHQNRFLLREFALSHAAFVVPTSLGSFNLAAGYFGFDLYNEMKIGVGYARSFGRWFQAGLQFNYHQFYVSEASVQPRAFTLEAGILIQPVERFSIGLHLFNVNQAEFSEARQDALPVSGKLGALYALNEHVKLLTQIQKTIGREEMYAVGLEYEMLELVVLRTGLQLPNVSNSFGLGLVLRSFSIDLSYAYRDALGSNASASLQYRFR